MGADCCSGGQNEKPGACSGSSVQPDHANHAGGRSDHHHGDNESKDDVVCCDEGDCADEEKVDKDSCGKSDESSLHSEATTCCGSEERCDEKCIITAAALECEKACDGDFDHDKAEGHQHSHDQQGHHTADAACDTHLRRAFDRYSAYLEQARCICRSILDISGPDAAKACCGSEKKAKAKMTQHHKGNHHHHSRKGLRIRRKADNNKMDELAITPASPDACCGGHDHDDHSSDDGHGHGHGGHGHDGHGSAHGNYTSKPFPNVLVRSKQADPEKDTGSEMVAIVVNGMTCSGCGDKMARTLQAVPGVTQVRVNFVMGNADFCIDTTITKPEEAIHAAETATGFGCTRVAAGDDHTLDVLASGPAAHALLGLQLDGVTDSAILDGNQVRFTYDPAVLGARDLFEGIGNSRCGGLAPPQADPTVASNRKRLRDLLIKVTVAAILTIPVAVLAWGHDLVDQRTKAGVSFALAILVQLIAIPEFYKPAISALVYSHVLEMDMLVVISITAAFLYSIVAFSFRFAGQPLETSEFFETSTLLITLILLGRLIAMWARYKAVSAVSLRSLLTTTAVLVDNNGKDREIDARLLQYGDRFKVLPHSRVPTDGIVVEGSSEVDESMLTGEPMPVLKQSGDHIIAGTINGDGTVVAQLTRLPGKNTVTDIAQMVEEAANSKPRLQDLANKVASWFVPAASSAAIISFVVWVVVGIKVRNYSAGKAVADAITYAVAVLAVSCPCALGLAVPMVLVIAGGIAAKGGIIIKSAECTERARKCTDVIFDKTGTITEGDLDVVESEYLIADQEQAMHVAKSLVSGGKHPVSAAVDKYLADAKSASGVTDIRVVPGAGVEADVNGMVIRAGNPRWTKTEALPAVARLQSIGLTTLVITRDDMAIAVFGLRTQLRPEATRVIAELKARKITVHLVSGDQVRAVRSVASAVGIPLENVAAERSPAEKRDYVASVMEDPKKYVMFCGDGTNDAVAVAQANIGAQMGGALSSSDVTQGAADVILLAGLDGIPFLLRVSRSAYNRMIFNFVWSAVYNLLAILLAAGAFVTFRLEPAFAGLAEIVSVLPVIFAATSMLLLNLRGKHGQTSQ
ncbi:copper-transporting P-type ATPase [Plectosphaerella cucumerina]|uniref:Copper-transporting P-type ATPase n=1 Tax=Plectosphaerella cucumerina TaxID=40658 RepID=A0A8K0TUN6_9PEZI|nr:copper-transporting P-type ATPase [Plectosphaerella cucumerina]